MASSPKPPAPLFIPHHSTSPLVAAVNWTAQRTPSRVLIGPAGHDASPPAASLEKESKAAGLAWWLRGLLDRLLWVPELVLLALDLPMVEPYQGFGLGGHGKLPKLLHGREEGRRSHRALEACGMRLLQRQGGGRSPAGRSSPPRRPAGQGRSATCGTNSFRACSSSCPRPAPLESGSLRGCSGAWATRAGDQRSLTWDSTR